MAENFEASFLYMVGADKKVQTAIVESEPEYDALIAAGWKTSPAEFGIETHPSAPAQPMPLPGVDPSTTEHAAQIATLEQVLLTLQQQVLTLQQQLLPLHTRIEALEGGFLAAQHGPQPMSEADTSEADAPSHRRRS